MQLFLVGKIVSEKHWEVQGIYDSEEKALSASVDKYHFIGTLTLNETLPLETTTWPEAYYPINAESEEK